MADRSLFYRPCIRLLSFVTALMGGPSPSEPDDPAVRFDSSGVDYHKTFSRGPVRHLDWHEVLAVAVLPGPIQGRRALCVYPQQEPLEPDITIDELFTGSGPGLGFHMRSLFGTVMAVHLHHVRGPSLRKLSQQLPLVSGNRMTLGSAPPR